MNADIEAALSDIRASRTRIERFERYYDGRHDLAFATEKFENAFGTLFREFALNLCPVVCDAVKDKLRIRGFGVDAVGRGAGGSPAMAATAATSPQDSASPGEALHASRVRSDEIWHENRMGVRAGEVHKEALKTGDAYVIVWPDASGRPVIYPNRAEQISVRYDDEGTGRIVVAAKVWRDASKHTRLNLFYPDRIEKYVSKKPTEGWMPDAAEFAPLSSEFGVSSSGSGNSKLETQNPEHFAVPNPFGIVPVFHFANNASVGEAGRSELEAAIPVQDGLNKAVSDMLVAMEYSAFRQRWVAGIQIQLDAEGKEIAPFRSGVDRVWVSENSDTRFGDFNTAELEQFLKVKDGFRIDIASVTGTPLSYLLQTVGDYPSGESLRRSEVRFLAKVRDRQESFGAVWADVMEFALRISGLSDVRLITEWEDPAPLSEREVLENILLKKQIGLPTEKALVEAGYGEADVKEMG